MKLNAIKTWGAVALLSAACACSTQEETAEKPSTPPAQTETKPFQLDQSKEDAMVAELDKMPKIAAVRVPLDANGKEIAGKAEMVGLDSFNEKTVDQDFAKGQKLNVASGDNSLKDTSSQSWYDVNFPSWGNGQNGQNNSQNSGFGAGNTGSNINYGNQTWINGNNNNVSNAQDQQPQQTNPWGQGYAQQGGAYLPTGGVTAVAGNTMATVGGGFNYLAPPMVTSTVYPVNPCCVNAVPVYGYSTPVVVGRGSYRYYGYRRPYLFRPRMNRAYNQGLANGLSQGSSWGY